MKFYREGNDGIIDKIPYYINIISRTENDVVFRNAFPEINTKQMRLSNMCMKRGYKYFRPLFDGRVAHFTFQSSKNYLKQFGNRKVTMRSVVDCGDYKYAKEYDVAISLPINGKSNAISAAEDCMDL